MKKIIIALCYSFLLLSCGSGENTPKIILPDPPKDLKYEVTGSDSDKSNVKSIVGSWNGTLGGKNIVLTITENKDGVVKGFNILEGNKRPLTGKSEDSGENYSLELKEPGDDKYDGVFNFEINKSTNKAEGKWKAYKGNAQFPFNFQKVLTKNEVTKTNIDGDLTGYIEAVPGKYLFEIKKNEYTDYNGFIKVKFKFNKSMAVKSGSGYNSYGPTIHAKILDEQGAPLEFKFSIIADKELASFLKKGEGEEWLKLTLNSQGRASSIVEAEKMLEKFKRGKTLKFDSEIIEEKFEEKSASNDDDDDDKEEKDDDAEKKDDASSSKCDKFLDAYEEFMVDYIKIMKEYTKNPSDAAIAASYMKLVAKMSKFDDIDGCENNSAFMKRYTAIQMKVLQAAQ
jgi:hypothetical protein